MQIAELKTGMGNVEIEAEISEMEEPKEVTTKFGTKINLTNAMLKDDSGQIKLVLWGEQSEGLEEGAKVKITNAFVKDFRGELQLGLTRDAKIEVLD